MIKSSKISIALIVYIWIDKRYLRYPYCGGFEK